MVVKKKTATRTRKKRKPKSRKKSFGLYMLLLNCLLLAISGGFFYLTRNDWSHLKWPTMSQPDPRILVESMLLASDIRLGTDLETFTVKGEAYHWKVKVNQRQRKDLVKAFKHLRDQEHFDIKVGQQKTIKGQKLQLVTFYREEKPVLKLILSLKKKVHHAEVDSPPVSTIPAEMMNVEPQPDPSVYWEAYEGPKIAIIIDDIGIKPVSAVQDLLSIGIPVTFAVLPFQRFTSKCAGALASDHYEIMLHMPMEPTNFPVANPGAGAIFDSFSSAKARETLLEALSQVPQAMGVNNHMGSRVTANGMLMRSVMDTLKDRHMFFVDSRTHASTVAFDTANTVHLPAAKRDVFLDATMSFEFTQKQIAETASIARRDGMAVAIGHPYPSTIAALAKTLPELKARGFSFVFASQVVKAR